MDGDLNTEYQVPIMFDVTAPSRAQAAKTLVAMLASRELPGYAYQDGTLESWWTIEAEDKTWDGNDNPAGTVTWQQAGHPAPRYIEVEHGERVVLPPGMTEVDLLKSMLRRVLESLPRAHDGRGLTFTREQLEAWVGRLLSNEEVGRLRECAPNSSIPDAISTIVDNFST